MRLGYELIIEQSQKLSMTPELIQAIQILQLNQQELAEYVGIPYASALSAGTARGRPRC